LKLGTDQLALAFVALVALSLAGIPFFVREDDSSGPTRGVVIDGRGFGVAGAAVFLFSEQDLQLIEEARTEEDGDFAFHLDTTRARVFVRPPAQSSLLPAWGPSAEEAAGQQAFVLRPARSLVVEVTDPLGAPLAGAEVRVYERRDEAAVIALATTDGEGRATLLAPARADVAVFAPDRARLARWRFDCMIPEQGATLSFALPSAHSIAGQVRGPAGALEGILLVSREEGMEGGWNGFAHSDAEGRFELPFTDAPSSLGACDPAGEHLPARLLFETLPDGPFELALERGAPLVVRVSRNGFPLGARVWSWNPASESWSYGTRTGPSGRAEVPAAARFGVRAEPLDPAYAPLEAWDVPYEEGTLPLEVDPRP
jgi:hypothetical protein